MTRLLSLLLLLAFVGPAGAAGGLSTEAQIRPFGHQISIGQDSLRVRQVVSPMRLSTPFMGGVLEAHAAAIYLERTELAARADSTAADSTLSLWSASDTEIRATWDVPGASLSAHVSIPSGRDELTGADSSLVRQFYRHDLNFPVAHLGRGLDLGGSISFGRQDGHVGYSVGLSFVKRGSYRPFSGWDRYKPGDQISASGGIQYTTGPFNVEVDLVGTFLFTDRLGGLVIYQNGKQATGRLAASFEAGGLRAALAVTEIHRFKDRRLQNDAFLFEPETSNGNDLRARAELSWSPHAAFALFGTGTFRDVRANAYAASNERFRDASRLHGYGGGLSFPLGRYERALIELQRQEGWIDGGDTEVAIWHARAALQFLF